MVTRNLPISFLLSTLLFASPIPAQAAERAFLTVNTADIDVSEGWYKKAFEVERVNRFERETHKQRVLIGGDLIVELVEFKPPSAKVEGRKLGIAKTGVEVDDFDRRLQVWRRNGVAPPEGGLFFDEALGLATVLLRDPDGNIVQVFGNSSGPFDATVKVSPDHKPQ